MLWKTSFAAALGWSLLCLKSAAAAEAALPVERWIPQDALVVVQVSQPREVLDFVLQPKLVDVVTSSPPYKAATAEKGFRELRNVIDFLENRFDTGWQAGLRKLTGGGITLALGPHDHSLLIVESEDAKLLEDLHEVLVFFARGEAEKQGDPDRVKSADYRGVTGWSFGGKEAHAIIGNRLLLANKPEALKAAVDRWAEPDLPSVATLDAYQASKQKLAAEAAATLFARFDVLKQLPNVEEGLAQERNPLGALVFAPVTQALLDSTWLAMAARVEGSVLALEAVVDGTMPAPPDPAAFASPAVRDGGAMPNLSVPRWIAGLSLYRDLHGFYAAKDELFPERSSGLIFFENMMGIFFTGRDFTSEVLAETGPEVRVVVAEQEYDPSRGTPSIQVPAFAAVFRMRDPEHFVPIVEEAWQKAVGLINFTRGQQALPGLIIDRPTHDGVKYTVAYFSVSPEDDKNALDVRFNFRPSLAMPGEYLILSSTDALAETVIDALADGTGQVVSGTNSLVELNGPQMASILEANREGLIRQNMVEQGNTRQEAETQVGLMLTVIRQFGGAKLEIGRAEDTSRAELTIELNVQ